jgi:hypothetical protein
MVEIGASETFYDTFAKRVINADVISAEERGKVAIEVFDEFGIHGESRKAWLDALHELHDDVRQCKVDA